MNRCVVAVRAISVAALVLASVAANGETIAICGASKGHSYYIPKGLVQAKDSGWTEDVISKGSFQLIRSGEDWDIIFTDASGGTLSSRGDGGQTVGFVTDDGDWS